MSKHTPGPWHIVNMRGWGGTCIGRKPQDEADGTAGDAPIAKVIDKAPHWDTTYPVEANARLIAAAPDLLEALEGVIGMAENFLEMHMLAKADKDPDVIRARAAIAKARGETV